MSTIKSDDSNITINASGSGRDIKFQANGVEKASIDSSGNLTVSGNLTSLGIDDNADATAMTIDSDEIVGVGVTSMQPWTKLQVQGTAGAQDGAKQALYVHSPTTTANEGTGIRLSATSGSNEAVGIIGMVNNASGNSGSMTFHTYSGGATVPERMRIDSSGNVGIGTTPESGISSDVVEVDMGLMSLSIWKGESQPNDSASYGYNCYKTGGFTYKAKKTSSGADNRPVVYEQAYGTHKFRVGAPGAADSLITWTDAMTIDNSGDVFVGTGSSFANQSTRLEILSEGASTDALACKVQGTNERAISFYQNGYSSPRGQITVGTSSVAYNTSSDYRLKENVDYDWDATTRLKQLKPARFNFIADNTTTVDGFLAHEAATVVPECVSGTKDAMRDEEYEVTPAVMDGDTVVTKAVMGTRSVPDYQGIDQSKLVPLLVKTIQELEARITALEA